MESFVPVADVSYAVLFHVGCTSPCWTGVRPICCAYYSAVTETWLALTLRLRGWSVWLFSAWKHCSQCSFLWIKDLCSSVIFAVDKIISECNFFVALLNLYMFHFVFVRTTKIVMLFLCFIYHTSFHIRVRVHSKNFTFLCKHWDIYVVLWVLRYICSSMDLQCTYGFTILVPLIFYEL